MREALEKAVDVYRGDLQSGCYDEWIEPERERLRQDYVHAPERLVRLLKVQEPFAEQDVAMKSRQAEELPLIGRHQEWMQLKAAWRETRCEEANLVVVMGQARIGKTHLVGELQVYSFVPAGAIRHVFAAVGSRSGRNGS